MNSGKFKLIAAMAALLMFSCRAPRDINYLQNMVPGEPVAVVSPTVIRVQPYDKIIINVSTQDERLSRLFNLTTAQTGGTTQQRGLGYYVDSEGTIDFPMLGQLQVAGLTREQIAELIKNRLLGEELVKNIVVSVDFYNLGVTILGDVKSPGFYNIEKDNFTLLEALGRAGDLTITGKRTDVKVIRNENGFEKEYVVNLCDANSVYSSSAYYLQQNDVIYVDANNTKARQSTANGNTLMTPGFWMGVASFVISLITIFVLR